MNFLDYLVYSMNIFFCCCSVAQLCLTLCSPMNCSTSGLSVPHHLPNFAQVHAHCIGDAIQPSHPLTPASTSAFNLSQHQELFPINQLFTSDDQNTRVSASASVLPVSIESWFPLGLTGLISSGVFSSTTIWRHQFLGTLPSLQSSSQNHTWCCCC